MKAYLLIFAPVFLLPCWTKPAGKAKAPGTFQLDMAPEAVDDDYKGCVEKMENIVEEQYFNEENKGIFGRFWGNNNIIECSNKPVNPQNQALTNKHRKAICLYTSKYIYKEFNEAVRTSKNIYGSSFKFHSLHFWLTSAIQILNNNSHCYTTYRRTESVFSGKVNSIIRFGTFASSSKKPDLDKFGSKTCFKIKTCLGAYLKNYSVYPREEEVLIPPYETFKIVDRIEGQNKFPGLKDCKRVFVLKSAGPKSYLNCKVSN